MPPVTVGPQQAVDNEALLVAQKAKELRAEQDRLAKLVRDAQAAKDAQDKAAAATAQAAAAKKIADQIAREEQKKKDEAARAKIAADSKRIDELKKAEAAAAAKLAEEKAAKELADARFQQESRYAAAAVQRAAFYSDASDYAANLGSVITGASIGGATDSSPLQCVRACNGNPSCIAFTTSVQHSIIPGLAVTYYKAALSRLPSNWNNMNIAKEAVVPNINFPSGSVQGNSGMSTNFAAVYQGFVTIPKAGQWVFFITSDDGSKL
jgi:flagellar biosynthesis GTPase FlhF